MKPHFKIIPYNSTEWKEAVNLREQILRVPLGSTFTKEELAEEKDHIQVVGYLNEKLIATAVLVPEKESIKMQRVVVDQSLRNKDIGSKMMVFCESYATETGYSMIYCHARDSAVNFYRRNDYSSEGDYFDEDGIPHLKMFKQILR